MRRRIVLATVAVVLVGIAVFGVPLAVVARRVVRTDELRRLDRDADAVGFAIADDVESGRAVERSVLTRAVAGRDRLVVVRDPAGRTTSAGRTPEGRTLTVTVHAARGTTVRITASARHTDQRVIGAVGVVAGLAAIGVAAAVGVAVILARRLAAPLTGLAETSMRLGAGDFSARADRYGIPEADAVADALNSSARRIEQLLVAEREFTGNASHQLRSPLTALRIHVEELAGSDDPAVRDEAVAALGQADRLDRTIDDLLALARHGEIGGRDLVDVGAMLREHEGAWRRLADAEARSLVVTCEPGCTAAAAAPALAQAVDALVQNAWRHGGGDVHVDARTRDHLVEILVRDEGDGIPPGAEETVFERHVSLAGSSGVGLALARTLVEADHGRLDLVQPSPAAFRILLANGRTARAPAAGTSREIER